MATLDWIDLILFFSCLIGLVLITGIISSWHEVVKKEFLRPILTLLNMAWSSIPGKCEREGSGNRIGCDQTIGYWL
jgi:hypothetical protein